MRLFLLLGLLLCAVGCIGSAFERTYNATTVASTPFAASALYFAPSGVVMVNASSQRESRGLCVFRWGNGSVEEGVVEVPTGEEVEYSSIAIAWDGSVYFALEDAESEGGSPVWRLQWPSSLDVSEVVSVLPADNAFESHSLRGSLSVLYTDPMYLYYTTSTFDSRVGYRQDSPMRQGQAFFERTPIWSTPSGFAANSTPFEGFISTPSPGLQAHVVGKGPGQQERGNVALWRSFFLTGKWIFEKIGCGSEGEWEDIALPIVWTAVNGSRPGTVLLIAKRDGEWGLWGVEGVDRGCVGGGEGWEGGGGAFSRSLRSSSSVTSTSTTTGTTSSSSSSPSSFSTSSSSPTSSSSSSPTSPTSSSPHTYPNISLLTPPSVSPSLPLSSPLVRPSQAVSGLVSDGRRFVAFSAQDSASGVEVWVYDLKDNRTFLVADINAGPASSNPSSLTFFEHRLFCIAQAQDGLRKIWELDLFASSKPNKLPTSPTSPSSPSSLPPTYTAHSLSSPPPSRLPPSPSPLLFASITLDPSSPSPTHSLVQIEGYGGEEVIADDDDWWQPGGSGGGGDDDGGGGGGGDDDDGGGGGGDDDGGGGGDDDGGGGNDDGGGGGNGIGGDGGGLGGGAVAGIIIAVLASVGLGIATVMIRRHWRRATPHRARIDGRIEVTTIPGAESKTDQERLARYSVELSEVQVNPLERRV